MAKGWTKEQLDALEARGGDLLLSAAAGSGKTAVLVERIIRRVLEDDPPVDIDRLLVVTFTHAAATEMSQRIGAAINEKMQQYPQNLRLQEQLTCLAHADIKTIHAFCLQVIRSYYYLLDMDPAARTADPSEIALLQQEVMDDLFETLYEEQDENFFRLLEIYGKKLKDDALKEQIQKIYNFSMGYPFPERLLEKMAQMDFEGAEKLLEQADEEMLKAHNCQTDIIQDEASGSEYPNCLLFNHSQDTLMSCMSHFSMAKSLLMILRSFAGRLDELNKEGGKCR